MPSQQTLAREHQAKQRRIAVAAVLAAREAAKATRDAEAVAAQVASYQLVAAATASASVAAGQGAAASVVDATAFVGDTAAGFPLSDPLAPIMDRFEAFLRQGLAAAPAALFPLDRFVHSEVVDAGRAASQVEMVAGGPSTSRYVRVLRLPSCERCAVLAGRVYRLEDAFDRHPLCDCEHWPVESQAQAVADGLVTDPLTAFEQGQIRGLSQADAQAIRDGADITQVINARRGMATTTLFGRDVKITLEGTTKRGWYGGGYGDSKPGGYDVEKIGRYGYIKNQARRRAQSPRLRPETIYAHAESREDAIRLLRRYGYFLGPAV